MAVAVDMFHFLAQEMQTAEMLSGADKEYQLLKEALGEEVQEQQLAQVKLQEVQESLVVVLEGKMM